MVAGALSTKTSWAQSKEEPHINRPECLKHTTQTRSPLLSIIGVVIIQSVSVLKSCAPQASVGCLRRGIDERGAQGKHCAGARQAKVCQIEHHRVAWSGGIGSSKGQLSMCCR